MAGLKQEMFDSIKKKFQFRLKDRASAANIMAITIKDITKKENNEVMVLGIPRGGVILGDIISRKIDADFDIIIPRKLTAPHNQELAIGAIMSDGTTYLNDTVTEALKVTPEYIEEEKIKQMEEIKRRSALYRRGDLELDLENKTIVLVDDGAASGATITVAARWLKKTYPPNRLIIALPIAPKETLGLLRKEADDVDIIITSSHSNFQSVGQYYQEFRPVSDEQVIEIMRSRNKS